MIPDYQTLMLPLLETISDGREYQLRDVINALSNKFNLTDEERLELLPSGNQAIIDNRVGWARTYLKKAGLLDHPRRGVVKINETGLKILSENPQRIDIAFLRGLPGFREWHESYNKTNTNSYQDDTTDVTTDKTPEELLDYSFAKLKDELTIELLEKIKSGTPASFEILVVDLLIKMGYGGSRKEAGQVMGKAGDGGIDGVIKEDKLGLDTIYVQAKKYENTVPISQVRDFAGSLLSVKAKKGIFISTSDYPQSADVFVKSIEPRIILIDGKQLAELMIEYNVGVAIKKNYEVKRLDTDYFDEL